MAVRITATIDNIDERTFDTLWRAGPGSRYEVVLDRIDGDHIETELHFRLVELTATQKLAEERERYPLRTIHVGGLGGSEPVMELPVVTTEYPAAELFMARASDLLAAIIGLTKISPLVLGIPSGDEALSARIYKHLTGQEPA